MKFKASYTSTLFNYSNFFILHLFNLFHYLTRSCCRTCNIEKKLVPTLRREPQDNTNNSPGVGCHKVYLEKRKNFLLCSLMLFRILCPVSGSSFKNNIEQRQDAWKKKLTRISTHLGTLIYKEAQRLHPEQTEGRHHVRLQIYKRLQTEEPILQIPDG